MVLRAFHTTVGEVTVTTRMAYSLAASTLKKFRFFKMFPFNTLIDEGFYFENIGKFTVVGELHQVVIFLWLVFVELKSGDFDDFSVWDV